FDGLRVGADCLRGVFGRNHFTHMNARSNKIKGRGHRVSYGSQKLEVRSKKSEVRNQKSDFRSQISDFKIVFTACYFCILTSYFLIFFLLCQIFCKRCTSCTPGIFRRPAIIFSRCFKSAMSRTTSTLAWLLAVWAAMLRMLLLASPITPVMLFNMPKRSSQKTV